MPHETVITHTQYPVTTIDVDWNNKLVQVVGALSYPLTGVVGD